MKELLPTIIAVLKDYRVIVTVIAAILVIKFAKFITTYKKKPKKLLTKIKEKKSSVAPAPAPQAEPSEGNTSSDV